MGRRGDDNSVGKRERENGEDRLETFNVLF